MKKSLVGIAAGALALTATMGGTAYAAISNVEVNGSSANVDYPFFASSVARGSTPQIDFATSGPLGVIQMGCSDAHLEGVVNGGPSTSLVATVSPVTRTNTPEFAKDRSEWKSCVGPFNTPMSVNIEEDWEIHADAGATGADTDTNITGFVSGANGGALKARVYATSGGKNGNVCNFDVEGYASGSFNEVTQRLTITEPISSGNLTVTTVRGNCLGAVSSGNAARFNGVFEFGPDIAANNTKTGALTAFPIYIN